MSALLKLYQDRLGTATTHVKGLSDKIEALLASDKQLNDPEVSELMSQRAKAFEDVDALRETIRAEQTALEAASADEELLKAYEGAGFVAPKGTDKRLAERIDKITQPHLRAFAIENPWTCDEPYRRAINSYVAASVRQNDDLSFEPFLAKEGLKASLMEMITDELGGYTVPPDVQSEILRQLPTFSTMRRLAAITPTTSNLVEWLMVQRATGAGRSIYTGTFVGGMVSETPSATAREADLKFTKLDIPVRKARVIGWFLEDFVSDSAVDILTLVEEEGSLNLAIVEDQQHFTGTGANGEILGLMNHTMSAADVAPAGDEIALINVEGPTANTISNTVSDRGSEAKLLTLIDAVPAQYRVGVSCAFVGHSKTRTKIRGLVSPQGQFLWRDELAVAINADGRAGSLEGYGFYVNDQIAIDGTDTNKVLIFGNFRAYRIIDRQRLSIRVSLEQKFDVEQVGVRLNSRFGGHVTNPQALAVGIV